MINKKQILFYLYYSYLLQYIKLVILYYVRYARILYSSITINYINKNFDYYTLLNYFISAFYNNNNNNNKKAKSL